VLFDIPAFHAVRQNNVWDLKVRHFSIRFCVDRPIKTVDRSVDRNSKVYKKYKDKDHPAVQRANRTAAKEIKKAKRNFEKKLAQNIKHDFKSFFAYVRSKTKSKIQAGAILSDKGTLLDSDIKTAQRFNEYFSSVFTAENALLYIPEPLKSQQELSSFCDLQFDVESVHKVLSKLRPDKAMASHQCC